MAEKTDKAKPSQQNKHIPKDAQVIMCMIRDNGITEYEPRVINQLLEFTYRYVTCLLDDAKCYANHAKKKSIDLDDIKLALQMQLEKTFITPPPREVVMQAARSRNSVPLPPVKMHCGLRLPQDRHCLNSFNFKLRRLPLITKPTKPPLGGGIGERGIKLVPKANVVMKRTAPMQSTPKTQTITITKPISQYSPATQKNMAATIVTMDEAMEEDHQQGVKRKREDDDHGFELM